MFYQVINGVDCFEVGIRQFGDFGIASGPRIYTEGYGEGDYVFVVCWPNYRNGKVELVAKGSRDFVLDFAIGYHQSAVSRTDVSDYNVCFYEVWHLVDDGDLWQVWDHDSELSRVDALVLLDERDIDGISIDREQLWSLNVPGVGRVSFLWAVRNGELVEEYCISDWQGRQPVRLRDAFWYDWLSVEEMLACIQSYEMLRDAGSFDVGGRVGADF